jgi:hypothetical protein
LADNESDDQSSGKSEWPNKRGRMLILPLSSFRPSYLKLLPFVN